MTIEKVNLKTKLDTFHDYWNPKIVGELNNQQIKLAKFKGEFIQHKHDQEDELFYVIQGKLFIELQDETIEINSGEFVIIPKGTEHKPFAIEEVSVMLIEPNTTLNTGQFINKLTKLKLEKI